jgi:hypothetical protein
MAAGAGEVLRITLHQPSGNHPAQRLAPGDGPLGLADPVEEIEQRDLVPECRRYCPAGDTKA